MTLSKQARLDNMEQALRLMLSQLGERPLYQEFFNPDDPAFAGIHNTSWKELEDRSLLKGYSRLQLRLLSVHRPRLVLRYGD